MAEENVFVKPLTIDNEYTLIITNTLWAIHASQTVLKISKLILKDKIKKSK